MHRNTPTARPQAPQLQKYLQDMVRALAMATQMTGDDKRAAFLLRNEPLAAFGYKTADTLIQDGRADAVIAYLESFAGGAAG
ncbi:MAG: MbcA/ParS/Xre antitoxin family protein [Xanthomonadales bacterium]|nr:MbcA/ParS/Xre antitoxin family protein [Xanthomonadales bacterium]